MSTLQQYLNEAGPTTNRPAIELTCEHFKAWLEAKQSSLTVADRDVLWSVGVVLCEAALEQAWKRSWTPDFSQAI